MHFKMDYISADGSAQRAAIGTLGVHGGDGSMLVGDRAHVLAVVHLPRPGAERLRLLAPARLAAVRAPWTRPPPTRASRPIR